MVLTADDIKTFGFESIKAHLKEITSSTNYFVLKENNTISICFKTSKYLFPIDKQYNRNYTIIKHIYATEYEFKMLLHSLILCKQLKHLKENNMPLHTFISEVISWVSMCISMLAYYRSEKHFTSRELYNLPYNIKEEIYNYIKENIQKVKRGVGTDSEGNTYNSVTLTEVN